MSSSDKPAYERIRISGRLTARSPLHIGAGESAEGPERRGAVREICRDARGLPYIPASTLRGHLRQRFLDANGQCASPLCQALFGSARPRAEEGGTETGAPKQTGGGRLRLRNARLVQDQQAEWTHPEHERLESRTALDPVTATVKPHHLLTERMVSPGAIFDFELEADQIGEHELQQLRHALQALSYATGAQIGQGKSIGRGGLDWQERTVQALTRADLYQWLLEEDKDAAPQWQTLPPLDSSPDHKSADGEHFILRGQLHALAPILVNDPHRPQPENKDQKENLPDHRFTVEIADATLRIPASTLKGLLRARARRILLTLMGALDQAPQDEARRREQEASADRMLDRLYGGIQRASRIRLYDCTAPVQEDEIHQQTFNAIDRFTGGVAHQRLYTAEAVHPKNPLPVRIALHQDLGKPHQHWALGLLLHLLRDAMEGDLAIGWGKAKGYGAFEIRPNGPKQDPPDFAACLDAIRDDTQRKTGVTPQALAEALETRIVAELTAAKPHD